MFAGTLVYGIVNSMILAVIAMGFSLTYGISNIANFAYGSMYVLAGYTAWILVNSLKLPFWLAIPLTVLFTAFLGAMMYRVILVRVRGMQLSEVIATFGMALVILEVLRYLGFLGLNFTLPNLLEGSVRLGAVFVDLQRVCIAVLGVLVTVGLWIFTHYTRTGLAFRGIAQDERTALSLGIDSDRVATLSMAAGGGLCAMAALVIYPIGNISIDGGYDVMIQALAVCILGGLGSTAGVIMASFVLGMGQTFSAMYLGSHWMMIVTLAAVWGILVCKPSGLMGKHKELEERI